jgi:hypothetical protein
VAVRDAAGADGRLSRKEAEKIPQRMYADNAVAFFSSTGQKSVEVEKLIGLTHQKTKVAAVHAAGTDGRLSLLEARMLPAELADDFLELRGVPGGLRGPAAAALAKELKVIGTGLDAVDFVYNIDDRVNTEEHVYRGAKSLDDVMGSIQAQFPEDGSWGLDAISVDGAKGRDAVKKFTSKVFDGLVADMTDRGEDPKAVEELSVRLTDLVGDGGRFRSVNLVKMSLVGPQIERDRAVLVMQTHKGQYVGLEADVY